MNKIVEVQNVTKVYGKNNEKKTQALSGISFDVEKGEFIGIMGASGSGKSTLLNILSTLDKPRAYPNQSKRCDHIKRKSTSRFSCE